VRGISLPVTLLDDPDTGEVKIAIKNLRAYEPSLARLLYRRRSAEVTGAEIKSKSH
jgi:hypothetical protein